MADRIARHLGAATDAFDPEGFIDQALNGLTDLELMERSEQFSKALEDNLSGTYQQNVAAMIAALGAEQDPDSDTEVDQDIGLTGFALMPMTSYVARCGLGVPAFSLHALCDMTSRFSSEFAVRPFFRDHTDLTLRRAMDWAKNPNKHIRRLASEGCRPRLPWGIRLQAFVRDPHLILPILENLRDDSSEYVRRSVANNLNDIAKDHPDLVAEIAQDWLIGADKNRVRLVKHACRTLIKNGHTGALAAIGFHPADLRQCNFAINTKTIVRGESLGLTLDITAASGPQKLAVDYVLHFLRANGTHSTKVFKWTELTLAQGEQRKLVKQHPFRRVTTRKDYPGPQRISVQINGQDIGGHGFELVL